MTKSFLLTTLLAAALSTQAGLAGAGESRTIHLSPTGDDAALGTAKAPFRTPQRARDEIRALRTKGESGPVIVEFGPGVYNMAAGLALDPSDSPTESEPVVYRAKEPGTAILTGARAIPLSAFRTVEAGEMLERLDPGARGKVLALNLAEAGIRQTGPFPQQFKDRGGIFELFDTVGRLPLSRWPNKGYTTMGPVLTIGDKTTPGVFEFKEERPLRWTANSDIWLKGQWRVGWEDPAIRVAAIDPAARTITFAAGIPNGIGSKYHRPTDGRRIGSGEEPWCAINLPEEIDMPGEWAIEFSTGTLFVWPRENGGGEIIVTELPLKREEGGRA